MMQIQIIAQWVENENVLSELQSLGVNFIQGYHVGYPEPMPTKSN